MSGTVDRNARPTMVTLESGIQAIIEVAGFAYIKPQPDVGLGMAFGEDVDAGSWVVGHSDGVEFKGVGGA